MPRTAPIRPIQHYGSLPAPKPVETDLKTLVDAANEAAKRESAQWFYFVTIMLTLTAIVGSTTHRVLFLEQAVKVPLLSVELPLKGFYWTAPAIFLVLHFYVLAQMRLLADKLRAFLDALEREARGDTLARDLALTRLDSFSVVQFLASERFGSRQVQMRLMASVTLVAAPVLLLLFFQLRFLPYHDPWITGWHRLLVGLDLSLIWWLWPTSIGWHARHSWRATAIRWTGAMAVVVFSWGLATVPNEWLETGGPLAQPRALLFDGKMNLTTQRPSSPFSRRLVLPDEDFLTDAQKKAWADAPEAARGDLPRTLVLRGRDLRFAVLDRADLRKADLTGADLAQASLNHAKLGHAYLDEAQMQLAGLDGAQMQGASLIGAQMQGTRLPWARLQGAMLNRAQMQGASLVGAGMQGVLLVGAQMQGASLVGAQMQLAWLDGAQMQGASLRGAQMQGASLVGARLQGAMLDGAGMQGASLDGVRLPGASLYGIAAWALRAPRLDLTDALIDDVDLADDPPCTESLTGDGSCVRERSWPQWAAFWAAMIPDGTARDRVITRLGILTGEPLHAAELPRGWPVRQLPDLERVAKYLSGLACAEDHAPYVARGLLRQIEAHARDLGPHAWTFAGRLADRQGCPGARDLDDDERAAITRLAARVTLSSTPPGTSGTLPDVSREHDAPVTR